MIRVYIRNPHPHIVAQRMTRDHVFPRVNTGRGMLNNLVLAHSRCNLLKGARQPTAEEIERARLLYESFGETAFVTIDELIG